MSLMGRAYVLEGGYRCYTEGKLMDLRGVTDICCLFCTATYLDFAVALIPSIE